VAEEAEEKKMGGVVERREKGSQWLSVVGWCLPVVELIVGRLVMRVVVAETAERERGREKYCKNRAERLVFSDFWTRFSPPSGHQLHLYL
jgi:hypothetical protein